MRGQSPAPPSGEKGACRRMRSPQAASTLGLPVGQGSIVSLIMDRIRGALLRKELRPGDYLPSELELTRQLGVGKSSIREAVKMLQAMGVVEVRRGQGTLIRTRPGPDVIGPLLFHLITEGGYPDDLVELRMMFEPAFAVMAMERATDEDRERLRATLTRLVAAVQAGTPTAEDDLAFHLAMLQATKNPLVIRIGETIFQLFQPSISVSMQTIARRAVADHRRIFAAFRARDASRLRAAVVRSYDGWKESLFRKPPDTPGSAPAARRVPARGGGPRRSRAHTSRQEEQP